MVGLGDLPGGNDDGKALAVSADGSIVVGESQSANGLEAFIWTQGNGIQGLSDLPGGTFASGARGISTDGSTIVGFGDTDLGLEAARWGPETGGPQGRRLIGLGDLPGGPFNSIADATSADGSIVVGLGTIDGGDEVAFIWDETNKMRTLKDVLQDIGFDLADWDLKRATAISDDGLTIAGNGINPQGSAEAWLVSIPEPATSLLLIAITILGLGIRRTIR